MKKLKIILNINKFASIQRDHARTSAFMIMKKTDQAFKRGDLSFNPNDFCCYREVNLSRHLQNILRKGLSERTPEDIKEVMGGLISLLHTNDFPLAYIEQLARLGYYVKVPADRVILRINQPAYAAYLLLSGEVMESGTDGSFTILKGAMFGERELLYGCPRVGTIMSITQTHLLQINAVDLPSLHQGRLRCFEDGINLLSEQSFMIGWPIERLLKQKQFTNVVNFRNNKIIVRDSSKSDWLYVVRSGSCRVGIAISRDMLERDAVMGPGGQGTVSSAWTVRAARSAIPRQDAGHHPSTLSEAEESRTSNPERDGCRSPSPKRGTDPQLNPMPLGQAATLRKCLKKMGFHNRGITQEANGQGFTVRRTADTWREKVVKKRDEIVYFVSLGILEPGQVFGLDKMPNIHVADSPSTCLVSLGAECVLLHKKFYTRHMPDRLQAWLTGAVQPYPSMRQVLDHVQNVQKRKSQCRQFVRQSKYRATFVVR